MPDQQENQLVNPEVVEQPQVEQSPSQEIDEITTLHERAIAFVSYIPFFAIVPFYLKKESKFCRFHGKQGMLITMVFFFASPAYILGLLFDIAIVVHYALFIYMGFAALSGKWKKLPLGYEWACRLEESLSLKTKEEEENDVIMNSNDQVINNDKNL